MNRASLPASSLARQLFLVPPLVGGGRASLAGERGGQLLGWRAGDLASRTSWLAGELGYQNALNYFDIRFTRKEQTLIFA